MKKFKNLRNPEIRLSMANVPRMYNLGAPILADTDYIVESANMKNGAYTIAHQPDVPRCLTLTHTAVDAADTLGIVTVVGHDILGKEVSEVLTPSNGTHVHGLVAFKSITSITGSGWTIGGGNDTIIIGVDTTLGLPFQISTATEVQMAYLDGTYVAPTVVADGEISKCTVDISSGTYDGSKKARVVIVEA